MKGLALVFCFTVLLVMSVFSDAYYPERPAPRQQEEEISLPLIVELAKQHDYPGLEHLLVFHTPDLSEPDQEGRTALHYAALAGSQDIVQILLRHGADPTLSDRTGYLPIHLAFPGYPELVRALSHHGKLMFALGPDGLSVLDHALREGPKAVDALLGSRYANIADRLGNTVLHYAAALGDPSVLSFLLARQVNVNQRNLEGLLPIDIAFSYSTSIDHAACAELLTANHSHGPSNPSFSYAYQVFKKNTLGLRFDGGSTALHLAAEADHQALTAFFLLKGIPADIPDHLLKTPLHRSAANDAADASRILLDAGADVDAVDTLRRSALHDAVLSGASNPLVEMLLLHGASPDSIDFEGITPLHLAAGMPGREQLFAQLLGKTADADIRDHRGMTALMHAVQSRNPLKIMDLLSAGSNMHLPSLAGDTAAQMMIRLGSEALGWIEAAGSLGLTDAYGRSLLHLASGMQVPAETLKFLLDYGLEPDMPDILGETPLLSAMRSRDAEAARLLLSFGADIFRNTGQGTSPLETAFQAGTSFTELILSESITYSRGPAGVTALHTAASMDLPEITSLLLQNGADVNAADDKGRRAVHIAARNGSIALLQVLSRYQANLQARDYGGNTPLHEAVRWKSHLACRFLLLANAPTGIRNLAGNTPLHIAVLQEDQRSIQALAEFSAPLEARDAAGLTALLTSAKRGMGEITALLVELDADIHARDTEGNSALHETVWNLDHAATLLLAERGADIHAKNRNGISPFLTALGLGKDPAAWLTGQGRIMVRDNDGNTPLHLAAANHAPGNIIELLLFSGADVNSLNNLLETPLHLAVSRRSRRAAELLIASGADIMIPDSDGITPLDRAISSELPILSWVLTQETMHQVDRHGSSPLHRGVSSGSAEAVSVMISLGADAHVKDNSGLTPLELAENLGFTDLVELLSAEQHH